jgi:hypothetical protein
MLRFSHELIQDVAYSLIPAARRAELHGRIGDILVTAYGESAPQHAEEIAHHYGRSWSPEHRHKLTRFLVIAGEVAMRSFAFDNAVAHFRRALESTAGHTMDIGTAMVLGQLGAAQFEIARLRQSERHLADAEASLARAAEYLISSGDRKALGQLVRRTEEIWFYLRSPGLARRVLKHLAAQDVVALSAFPIGDNKRLRRRIRRHNRRLFGRARRRGDAAAESAAVSRLARVEMYSLRAEAAWKVINRAARSLLDITDQGGAELDAALGQCGHLSMWYPASRGRLDVAEVNTHAYLEKARSLGWKRAVATGYVLMGSIRRAQGRLAEALVFAKQGQEVAPRDIRLVLLQASCEYIMGNDELADATIERLRTIGREGGNWNAYPVAVAEFADLYKMTGHSVLRQTALQVNATAGARSESPLSADLALTGLAIIAAVDRNKTQVSRMYRRLRQAPRAMRSYTIISRDRLRGLLCWAAGRTTTAARHFDRAIQFARAGYRLELAWTYFDLAAMLLEKPRRRSLRRVRELLRLSNDIAAKTGMGLLLRRIGSATSTLPDTPDHTSG